MIFRREFLQLGLAAGAGSLLPPLLFAAGGEVPAGTPLPLFRLIHDTREAASLDLAHALGSQLLGTIYNTGTADSLLRPVHGDVTRFWYDELQPVWQAQRVAVAGTTSHDVLFCLEQLARDHQLRVLWRREHVVDAGVPLVSWLIAAA
jgi:hypothetical protein